jgi:N-acetylglucosaminyldiphosphoundecaprenol N-acetyl-beta-D-mannosaminyltransferase
VLADIQEQSPDILLAALGMPYQEKWLHQHRQQLNCGVMIGIGGSFDVIAGQVRRAPNLLRQLRLEWLWRLACQPSRWRRYLAIPPLYAGSEKRA